MMMLFQRPDIMCHVPLGGGGLLAHTARPVCLVSRKTLHVLSTWVGTVTRGEGDKKANVLNGGRADLNR